jgi:hypothetical protein
VPTVAGRRASPLERKGKGFPGSPSHLKKVVHGKGKYEFQVSHITKDLSELLELYSRRENPMIIV